MYYHVYLRIQCSKLEQYILILGRLGLLNLTETKREPAYLRIRAHTCYVRVYNERIDRALKRFYEKFPESRKEANRRKSCGIIHESTPGP